MVRSNVAVAQMLQEFADLPGISGSDPFNVRALFTPARRTRREVPPRR
jgi:hypothetical protein